MLIIALATISILIFVLSVRQERRRFANILLFVLAGGLTVYGIGTISDSGHFYTYIISYLFFLFAIGSLLLATVCLIAFVHHWRAGKKRLALYRIGGGIFALVSIPFFYYTASGMLFGGVLDSILHLILFLAVYFNFAFLALVSYSFLSHLTPTRTKWDYILLGSLPAGETHMSLRLRHRLDDAIALRNKLGYKTRIILPDVPTTAEAVNYLTEYGIEEDKIRILTPAERTWRMKLSALADEPVNIKPYHTGLILVEDYLACRIQHELSELGLHGTVIGYPSAPIRRAVKLLTEYQNMIWAHRIGILTALFWWLIICIVSIWW